jgi:exodeoxyribonuclease-3
MRLVSWNVNGIRAAQRKGLLGWFAAEAPDILCLQETKAHPEQLDGELREIAGYHAYWSSAQTRKGYSGVAVYSRTEPRAVSTAFGTEEFDIEGRILMLDLGAFLLYNIYFPNGGRGPERLAYKLRFYEEFLRQVCRVRDSGRHVVMCGDFNVAHQEIDLADPEGNRNASGFLPEERGWMDRLLAAGFVDTFRMFSSEGGKYTWWDMRTRARPRNDGWRIDYFVVDEGLRAKVSAAGILAEIDGSDHCPVDLELSIGA